MTKTTPGPDSTKRAIHHGEGLSVDCSFVVSSQIILVDKKIMLELTLRLVGSPLWIIVLEYNMVSLVAAKHPQ